MYFGSNDSLIVVFLLSLFSFNFLQVPAFLIVSLQSWNICDMGFSKLPPKVCVMQRNIDDFLQLRPKILLSDGEEIKKSHWYRMVRLFPGDKTFETLISPENKGTYFLKNESLEIPTLKEVDMDKNGLKYSAIGSYGTSDQIIFVIQQVPVEIPKYLGDAMLIDLSHYMTIPATANHFHWTYRADAKSPEVVLPKDLTQHRQMLKAEAITAQHQGLYICSFYAGQQGAMAFFLGQKIFQMTIIDKTKDSTTRRAFQADKKRKKSPTKSRPAWHVSALDKLTKLEDAKVTGRVKAVPYTNHRRKIQHSFGEHVKPQDRKRLQMSKRKMHLRFETAADEDEEESGNEEDEEEEEENDVTTAKSQAVPKPSSTPAITQPIPMAHGAKDFAAMPGRTLPSAKPINSKGSTKSITSSTESSKTSKDSLKSFSKWMVDYVSNIKEEVKAFQVHNGSVMDFEGSFPSSSVRYIKSGNEVILQCTSRMADGTLDKSKIVWKRVKPLPGVLTTSSDRYEILDSGDLKILRTVGEDSGEYGCEIDGKQATSNVPLSVAVNPLPRTFLTVKFTSSTCKAYLLEKVTHDFLSKMAAHICPDEKCSMATPVMQCHMSSQDNARDVRSSNDIPALNLSFNFKLGANFKLTSEEELFKSIKEIHDKAVVYIEKHGQIYQPDIFDGKFAPMMETMSMKTYAYCPPGFGIKGEADESQDVTYKCLTCAPGHYNGEEKPICLACNFSQYQAKPAATSCQSCPGKTRVGVEGATSGDDCEDPVMGMLKHNIIIVSAAFLGFLLALIGTFILVKRRLSKKDVKAKMLGLEREKNAPDSAPTNKIKTAAVTEGTTNLPVTTTPSTQVLQNNQQYPNQIAPMPNVTASQMALHPSYTYMPPILTAAPPASQVSIILNNQIPQPVPQSIPPPPQPAAPAVQPARPIGQFSSNPLPGASCHSLNQMPNGSAVHFPTSLPYPNSFVAPTGPARLSYHQLPTKPIRGPSLQRLAGPQSLRNTSVMPGPAGLPDQQQLWRRSSFAALPRPSA